MLVMRVEQFVLHSSQMTLQTSLGLAYHVQFVQSLVVKSGNTEILSLQS